MRVTALNHVSIPAVDLEASKRFYTEVFGMDVLPAPNFGMNVVWLRIGNRQIHLFETDTPPGGYQHLGMEVDDFEHAYRKLKEVTAFGGDDGYFGKMYVMPDGGVQMYFHDPAGNMLEIDHPSVDELDRDLFGDDLEVIVELRHQTEENLRASLWQHRDAELTDRYAS
ncbi:MAG: VOC family protein [Actinomycetia bacterium]|nr:VOC family protein [Actinomycetes bacterium]